MAPGNTSAIEDQVLEQEVSVLRKFGLRWSILAAWRDALELRRVALPPETDRALEMARVKLASGCFSACTVGCDLNVIEGALTSADASSHHNWVDFWLDLLGHSMRAEEEAGQILRIPAVKARYQSCGITGCQCDK